MALRTTREMEEPKFCIEDLCCLKVDLHRTAIVERTTHDVDQHHPYPQKSYDGQIERNKEISRHEFDKFMKSGVPPPGSVLIQWLTGKNMGDLELTPTKQLSLLDRSIIVGDTVQKTPQDAMSGTVIGAEVKVGLVPPPALHLLQQQARSNGPRVSWKSRGDLEDLLERNLAEHPYQLCWIPAEELRLSSTYVEGDMVLYRDWVGRVEDFRNDLYLRLSNGSVVVPDDSDDVEILDNRASDVPEVGFVVRTKRGNLRRGRWISGAYDANVDETAIVVHTETTSLTVHWLCRRLDGPAARVSFEPPRELPSEAFNSPDFTLYDRSRSPKGQMSSKDVYCAEFLVGNSVEFRDPARAALKYDGSQPTQLPDGQWYHNHFQRTPKAATSGYDLNVLFINATTTYVTVLWQDLTKSTHKSIEVVPQIGIEDESLVWPGEIVVSMERKTPPPNDWLFEPARVGVVQSVNAADRVANVRWFRDASVLYHNIADMDETFSGALLPGSSTGTRSADDPIEELSIYDIRLASGISKRRGDFVILHPPSSSDLNLNKSATLDWVGEVIDLGLDGLLTVRLGALKEVRDVKIAPEYATLAFNNEMLDNFADQLSASSDDYLSQWSEPLSEMQYLGADRETRQWYEYDGGDGRTTVVSDHEDKSDEDAWSTENEEVETDELDDVIMADVDDAFAGTDALPDPNVEPKVGSKTLDRTDDMTSSSKEVPSQSVPALIPAHAQASPPYFLVLDTPPPSDSPYVSDSAVTSSTFLRRINKEHKILASSLPPGIFVRTWESRMDILRVLIIGPLDTPYEYAPFLIDVKLAGDYPNKPPEAFFHSWTEGQGPVNPNLYENGKICLSLLGTWHADSSTENWNPVKSTILQILVSILGLVLVKEPYYNEAGFEARAGTPESRLPSRLYSERAYFRSRRFITHALRNSISGFDEVIKWLYLDNTNDQATPRLLHRAIESARDIISRTESPDPSNKAPMGGGLSSMSKGALVMLKRQLAAMEALQGTADADAAAPRQAADGKYQTSNVGTLGLQSARAALGTASVSLILAVAAAWKRPQDFS